MENPRSLLPILGLTNLGRTLLGEKGTQVTRRLAVNLSTVLNRQYPRRHRRPQRRPPTGHGQVRDPGRHCLRHLAVGPHPSFPRSPRSSGRRIFSHPQGRCALGGRRLLLRSRGIMFLRGRGRLARHRNLLCSSGS
jgi:hypothetical protein